MFQERPHRLLASQPVRVFISPILRSTDQLKTSLSPNLSISTSLPCFARIGSARPQQEISPRFSVVRHKMGFFWSGRQPTRGGTGSELPSPPRTQIWAKHLLYPQHCGPNPAAGRGQEKQRSSRRDGAPGLATLHSPSLPTHKISPTQSLAS